MWACVASAVCFRQNIKETGIRVIVVANIQLTPPVVYMLPYTHVTYRVELLSQGHAEGQCLNKLCRKIFVIPWWLYYKHNSDLLMTVL